LTSNYSLEGKHVVIINRSKLVGRPLAKLLLDAGSTVTVCHSKTRTLHSHTKSADILVVAVGIHDFIHYRHIKHDAVVVDVGINRVAGKLCGDVSDDVAEHGVTVTPVPGGVGLLTRACLMTNVLDAHCDN
jgi:methylenetetrahydrofolate dehydrogenase (NADP+)/methenyltetrahydrofolate cyclohydrolase